MGRTNEAISALNSLLDFSPTDAEAWAELADLHFTQGLYSQSIFALEEVLTLQPNAWNVRVHKTRFLQFGRSNSPRCTHDWERLN